MRKAAEVLELGADAVRTVPVDGDFRMDVGALRAAVTADRAAGRRPFCVAASAGTVSTGAIDPLDQVASVCQAEDLWSTGRPRRTWTPWSRRCGRRETGSPESPETARPAGRDATPASCEPPGLARSGAARSATAAPRTCRSAARPRNRAPSGTTGRAGRTTRG
jgi:Pyridoxal-dependent decarboxylase conserved domain